jgi:hypothetical protein
VHHLLSALMESNWPLIYEFCGAGTGIRTRDLRITRTNSSFQLVQDRTVCQLTLRIVSSRSSR